MTDQRTLSALCLKYAQSEHLFVQLQGEIAGTNPATSCQDIAINPGGQLY